VSEDRDTATDNALLAEQFTRLFTHGLLPMAVSRADGDMLRVNDAFCRMLGRSEEWLCTHSYAEFSAPDGHREDQLYLARVASAGGSYVRRKAYLHADGHPVWCEVHVSSVSVPRTGEIELVVLARDISELIADGEELEARHRRRDLSQAAAHVGSWETSPVFGYRYWSDEMKRLHLRDPEDPVPTFEEFLAGVHPDDREILIAALRDRRPYRVQYRYVADPGNVRVLVDSGDFTLDADGGIVWQTGTTIDVTEMLAAERQLRLQQQLLETSQEAGHVGTWHLDLGDRTLTYSAEFARLHHAEPDAGQDAAPVTYDAWLECVHPADRAALTAAVGSAEEHVNEYRVVRGPGDVRVLVSRGRHLPGEDGHPGYRVGVTWDVTEERLSHAAIRHADLQFRRLFDTSPIGMLVRELDGPVLQVNDAYCRMLGRTQEEMLDLSVTPELLTHPDDIEADAEALAALRRGDTNWYVRRKRYRHADGHWIWAEVSIAEMASGDGSTRELTVQARDITATVESENALRRAEERFRRGFDTSLLGMMLFARDGVRHYVNDALCDMLGYDRETLLRLGLMELNHPDDLDEDFRLIQLLTDGEISNYVRQKRFRHAEGHYVWVEVCVARMDLERGHELVAHIRDITESLGYERQLRHLAEHDHLTGLFNRRAFEERVREFADATGGRAGALLLLDLDGFKHHNDTYGHAVGDAILVGIASAMAETVPEDAVVGRQGGDEFAVLLPDRSVAEEVAARLLVAIAQAAAGASPSAERPVTVSIGVAPFTGDPDLDLTMLRADQAMYAAKEGGRNRVEVAAI